MSHHSTGKRSWLQTPSANASQSTVWSQYNLSVPCQQRAALYKWPTVGHTHTHRDTHPALSFSLFLDCVFFTCLDGQQEDRGRGGGGRDWFGRRQWVWRIWQWGGTSDTVEGPTLCGRRRLHPHVCPGGNQWHEASDYVQRPQRNQRLSEGTASTLCSGQFPPFIYTNAIESLT